MIVQKNRRTYHLFKNYALTDISLKTFANDMIMWTNDLQSVSLNKNETKSLIDYSKYCSLRGGVTAIFNYFCGKKYKSHEPITCTEFKYFESCGNLSHQYLDEECKNTVIDDCCGYDFNKYYCRLLGKIF